MTQRPDIGRRAVEILRQSVPRDKAGMALALYEDWACAKEDWRPMKGPLAKGPPAKGAAAKSAGVRTAGDLPAQGAPLLQPMTVPLRPARPLRPPLVAPGDVPRRRMGSPEGRIGLLHALSHIELNAIDLAADLLARFGNHCPQDQQPDFISDWVCVCADEARHFILLADRLESLGSHYGALPAHGGLWEIAEKTAGDILARLAIAPLVLEARGLDVTPDMIMKLERHGDGQSAAILRIILEDEIGHVRIGYKWFETFCADRRQCGKATFRNYVAHYFPAGLKPPFNHEARLKAGFDRCYYADTQ